MNQKNGDLQNTLKSWIWRWMGWQTTKLLSSLGKWQMATKTSTSFLHCVL